MMIVVVWDILNFLVVEVFPKNSSFNADYYCEQILSRIVTGMKIRRDRKSILHVDDMRPHMVKATSQFMSTKFMKPAPHPTYSPDLAFSDFFLFDQMKDKLREQIQGVRH
jgi:histone-lysine N-methyltransferase SETMAR